MEESSDSSEDDDRFDDDRLEGTDRNRSRNKKIRKVDVSYPLSMFRKQTRQRKRYIMPSKFIKDEWLGLRGMDDKGKFIQDEDSRAETYQEVRGGRLC